jgi:hypothetical protein
MSFLRRAPLRWIAVLVLSVLTLIIVLLLTLVADQNVQLQSAAWLRGLLANAGTLEFANEAGGLLTNDVVSGVTIAVFSSLITLSLIYIYKVPDMRRISIQILAAGYYENFLHRVIQKVYEEVGDFQNNVLIVLPGFALVENKTIYWKSFHAIAVNKGFEFVQETTDADFGRNIFAVQKAEVGRMPIFIDMPTTLTNLKKIIELEEHSPVGRISQRGSIKRRFYHLRDQFEEELRQYVTEHDWGNVRFIEGRSLKAFNAELEKIFSELEDAGD